MTTIEAAKVLYPDLLNEAQYVSMRQNVITKITKRERDAFAQGAEWMRLKAVIAFGKAAAAQGAFRAEVFDRELNR